MDNISVAIFKNWPIKLLNKNRTMCFEKLPQVTWFLKIVITNLLTNYIKFAKLIQYILLELSLNKFWRIYF